MPKIDDIIKGVNITAHYLDENKEFKIFRHKKNVYAVRYENDKPIDFAHMWRSHAKEKEEEEEKVEEKVEETLGKGQYGVVKPKTIDKAQKYLYPKKNKEDIEDKLASSKRANIKVLQQKFMLKKNNIDQYFVLGLWNININKKYKENKKPEIFFNMPRIDKNLEVSEPQKQDYLNKFVLALKKVNELGYAHDDLASRPNHTSFQNLLLSNEGYKAIDLDTGLLHYQKEIDLNDKEIIPFVRKSYFHYRDQWIYVYNGHITPKGPWRNVINEWYNLHENMSLSENPDALLTLYGEDKISLPNTVVADLVSSYTNKKSQLPVAYLNKIHQQNSQQPVSEYLGGKTSYRPHGSREVSTDDFAKHKGNFDSQRYKAEYENIKGDAFKRAILNELKDSLGEINTLDDLKKRKDEFYKSPEMTIINKAQGLATEVLSKTGFVKTDSFRAVEKIFRNREKELTQPSPKVK